MSILERKDLKEINRNDIFLSFSFSNYKSGLWEFFKVVFGLKDASSFSTLPPN